MNLVLDTNLYADLTIWRSSKHVTLIDYKREALVNDDDRDDIAKLEHALSIAAWVVEAYGEKYLILFEALERQLEQARSRAKTLERTKRVLAKHRRKTKA